MPARETLTPWAVPFHVALTAFRRKFPEGEVSRVMLLWIMADTGASLLFVKIKLCEFAVLGELTGVIVNPVINDIGVAFVFQDLNQFNLFLNMICSFGHMIRFQHV